MSVGVRRHVLSTRALNEAGGTHWISSVALYWAVSVRYAGHAAVFLFDIETALHCLLFHRGPALFFVPRL
ncbi:hypothetical protein [Salinisphaera sp. T5B8]|uniref:hypothetical protein n=1 Tax=Salinisphaera sp. T5B8 TaxID=1304154 RepID=UPI003342D82A